MKTIIHVTVLTKSKAGLASKVLDLNCLVTFITKNSCNVPMKHLHIVSLLFSRLFLL